MCYSHIFFILLQATGNDLSMFSTLWQDMHPVFFKVGVGCCGWWTASSSPLKQQPYLRHAKPSTNKFLLFPIEQEILSQWHHLHLSYRKFLVVSLTPPCRLLCDWLPPPPTFENPWKTLAPIQSSVCWSPRLSLQHLKIKKRTCPSVLTSQEPLSFFFSAFSSKDTRESSKQCWRNFWPRVNFQSCQVDMSDLRKLTEG